MFAVVSTFGKCSKIAISCHVVQKPIDNENDKAVIVEDTPGTGKLFIFFA